MLESEVLYPKGYLSPGEEKTCCVFMPDWQMKAAQIINL